MRDRFESKNYYANMTELERSLGIGVQVADLARIRQIVHEEKLIIIGQAVATGHVGPTGGRVPALRSAYG